MQYRNKIDNLQSLEVSSRGLVIQAGSSYLIVKHSLRPKKTSNPRNSRTNQQEGKMTMFAPIYYPYLALIDSCTHMHFLNRVEMTCFWDKF